ncbi:MAG: hypothetical protein LBK06_08770 [Planctomycetaceae bacterium]|jgi:hypothetical protein|nr:hypothetical protein [Planctomycetaceae bacterium]
MDTFSQHNLKSPATEPEHAVRKAEFDAATGNLTGLHTMDKSNLVTAINEVYTMAGAGVGNDSESGKTAVAYALGQPSSSSDTFTQLADRIQNDKNDLVSFLTSRTVPADSGESLSLLLSKLYSLPDVDHHPYKYRFLTLADFPGRNSSDPNLAEGRYHYGSTIYFPGWTPLLCFVDGDYWASTSDSNYQIRGGFWLSWNASVFGSVEHVATSNSAGTNTYKTYSEIHNDGNITSNEGVWLSGSSTYILYQKNSFSANSITITRLTRSSNYTLTPRFCLSAWRKPY